MTEIVIRVEDSAAEDVQTLLRRHRSFAVQVTPPGHVHALDVDEFSQQDLTLFSARREGDLLGIGALRRIDDRCAEVKSMHTREDLRSTGIGGAILTHLVSVARQWGCAVVLLETGTMDAFAPARRMYHRFGFRRCPPFGDYTENPHSICMRLDLAN